MFLVLVLGAVGLATLRIWGRRRALLVLSGLWLAGMVLLLLAPERGAGLLGLDARGWAVAGGAVTLAFGYARLVSRARSRARDLVPDVTASDPRAAPLSGVELDRYARHIVLREIGGPGQQALRRARVLVIGAGGLGAPVCLYLAAAGVGRITLADDDAVSLSNLQRQVLFRDADLGRPKAATAAAAMVALNPHVAVEALARRIGTDDAALIGAHDLVIDGTDSFASRAAINRACVVAGVPLLAGAITQWEGQVTVYDPARGAPCLACLFPSAPAPGLAPSCAEAGVVGALPGVVGSLMALEAIKLLTGAGQSLRGRLMLFDGLWGESRLMTIAPNPTCPVCAGVQNAGSRGRQAEASTHARGVAGLA